MLRNWAISGGRNAPIFNAPLINSAVPDASAGSSTPTFTRSLATKSIVDFEGLYKTILSGEVGFNGARRVANLCVNSETLTAGAGWTVANATSVVGATDPNGGTTAYTFTCSNAGISELYRAVAGRASGSTSTTISIYLRRVSGTAQVSLYSKGTPVATNVTLTTSWQRFAVSGQLDNSTVAYIGVKVAQSTDVIEIWHPLLEDVTGQTNQNPSEYVSVGVLSSPYHGAMVDGVKYFSTLNGNTVSSNVVTEATGAAINSSTAKFASLGGAYLPLTTPSSSALTAITSDQSILVRVAPSDWTPVSETHMSCKWSGGATDGWEFYIDTSGGFTRLNYLSRGTNTIIAQRAAGSSLFSDGVGAWLLVTCDADNGAGGSDTKFWYAPNTGGNMPPSFPSGWTQLGATVTTAGVHVRGTTADVMAVGSRVASANGFFTGNVYLHNVYSSVYADGATPVSIMDPNTSTTGQTWVSSTTETWTVGVSTKARIFGNTNTTYGIPAPWDATGPVGYNAEPQAINLCLQSQTFDNASWVKPGARVVITADQYVAPDGTTTADKLATTAAGSNTYFTQQTLTTTAVANTFTVYAKYTNTQWLQLDLYDAVTDYVASFDILNGVVGLKHASATSSITSIGNGWYRCSVTATTAASAGAAVAVGLSDVNSATLRTWTPAGTETAAIWQAQLETGSVATSPITTTTVAVTRNADKLTYVTSGNLNSASGSCYCEFTTAEVATGFRGLLGADGNDNLPLGINSNHCNTYDGTTAVQSAGILTANTAAKAASFWTGSTLAVVQNGGTVATGAFDGSMAPATIAVGVYNGANQLNGSIRNVQIYAQPQSAAYWQARTT